MYLYLLSGCFVCLFVFAASFLSFLLYFLELLWWLSYKESTCHAGDSGDTGLIPVSGRSPGGGHGNTLQYSCQENSVAGEAWWAVVQGITNS